MGADLKLRFLKGPEALTDVHPVCLESLDIERDQFIFNQLDKFGDNHPVIETIQIPPQMWIGVYGEDGFKEIRKDRFDRTLTFTYAKELKKLEIPENAHWKNKAIKAFINMLPDNIPVILCW